MSGMVAAKNRGESKRPYRAAAWIEPICVECGKMGRLCDGPRFPKPRYVCECGASVAVHPGTSIPMGFPCNKATARARREAHRQFDPIWTAKIERGFSRRRARDVGYAWLARELGIDEHRCHIAMFDRQTAILAAEVCFPLAEEIRRKRV